MATVKFPGLDDGPFRASPQSPHPKVKVTATGFPSFTPSQWQWTGDTVLTFMLKKNRTSNFSFDELVGEYPNGR